MCNFFTSMQLHRQNINNFLIKYIDQNKRQFFSEPRTESSSLSDELSPENQQRRRPKVNSHGNSNAYSIYVFLGKYAQGEVGH